MQQQYLLKKIKKKIVRNTTSQKSIDEKKILYE